MATILVTGGSGFIGSHVCEALIERGDQVICVDNLITGQKQNLKNIEQNERFEYKEHDIIEPLKWEGPIDEIYNLACPASPIDYQELPLETLLASAHGTKNILDLARAKGAKVLHVSTSEVYGDPLEHPQNEHYFGNVNCIGPRSCYDEGKRYAESLIINYECKFGVEAKIVRIFNTYGPRMRKNDGRVIPNFITQALRGEDVTIYGDGYQTRSFCYIDDMISGLLKMMEQEGFNGPVNLGNPEEVSIKGLAERIIAATQSTSKIHYLEAAEDDPKVRRPDITLAREKLEFMPQVSLDQGLKKTIYYFA